MFGLKIKNILFIIVGAAIFSFGLVHFNMQNNLGEGGFTGITLLLYFLWDINPAFTNLLLNIPIFIIGWKLLGRTIFLYTLVGTFSVSVFLYVFQINPFLIPLQADMTLAALFAGVFIGIGLGITFRYGGTTGGVDIIARIVHKYFGWTMGRTMFIFDFFVITISIFTYLNLIEGMYTLVVVYISARVIDFIQEGAYSARGATIISEKYNEIADQINGEMERGVTVLKGKGHYTQKDQYVLYCVIGKNEIIRLKHIIDRIDTYTFVALNSVHEVICERFTSYEYTKPIE